MIRRIARPQREVLDGLRRSDSPVVSETGRRRFSDAFDVAGRLTHVLESTRTGLAETLDAYRGAQATEATEVTRVLTIYAAVMLPLALVAGFFGMNFANLPWVERRWGWWAVLGSFVAVALVSLGMFVRAGWIRPFSPKRAGTLLGQGLWEASKAPVQVVGALYEVTAKPLYEATAKPLRERGRPGNNRGDREG